MPENVLLVTIDSLRYDSTSRGLLERVGFENDQAVTASFRRAFATGPGTTPSFPAILTGSLPLSYDGLGPLSKQRPRLSEMLGRAGLATAAFQCNPFLSATFNYDVGFDMFEDYQNPLMGIATKIFPRGIEINNPRLKRIDDILHFTDAIKKSYKVVKGKPRPYVSAEVITDDAIEWFAETDEPFFCWTHFMDVHHPCFPPKTYRERHKVVDVTQSEVSEWYAALVNNPDKLDTAAIENLRRLYDAAIEYTGDQVGRIIDYLKETGRYDDTLIVLTSDHGELFGEHGQYGKPERMWDELLHVPLVVANGPANLAEATEDLVSLLDIPPLVHDSLGFDVPDVYEGCVPGRNEPREHILAEHEVEGNVVVGARSKKWLYEGDEIDDEYRLFDTRDGDFNQVDRNHSNAAVVRDIVRARLKELDVETKYLQGNIDEDIEDRLEDLGYL